MERLDLILLIAIILALFSFLFFKYIRDKQSKNLVPYVMNEVFHIYNNTHTYEMAREKCKLYGGRLATESEVKDAYNKGKNWCNYGWSEGQKILYPAQKKSVHLEKTSGTSDTRCLKEGVVGGYYPNTGMRFGVNCYGVRPSEDENDLELKKVLDERRRKMEDKIKRKNQGMQNERLKTRNQERLKNEVRKSMRQDGII
jgi:hypothetical protein